jgi:tRNA (adenine22-N1)-methyltransferase
MKVKLSSRLAAVASFVPLESTVADIGTDHGYLPVHLVTSGICSQAIASDTGKKPLLAAEQLIKLLALDKKIDLRLGDGLRVLHPGEAETVCIAGMGGATIIKILEEAPAQLGTVKRLILQPMKVPPQVREWLMNHDWRIVGEEIVFEDKLFYEIIAAEPGREILSEEELEVGPVLLKTKHPMLKAFLTKKVETLEYILKSLEKSSTETDKQTEIINKAIRLKRVIRCL